MEKFKTILEKNTTTEIIEKIKIHSKLILCRNTTRSGK